VLGLLGGVVWFLQLRLRDLVLLLLLLKATIASAGSG
jgi:hypothetical protein